MQVKETLEMRGMKRKEIIEYFFSLNEKPIEPNKFQGNGWYVKVNEETQVHLGAIEIPSTIVEFCGEKDQVEKILADFRLRFLSAGG